MVEWGGIVEDLRSIADVCPKSKSLVDRLDDISNAKTIAYMRSRFKFKELEANYINSTLLDQLYDILNRQYIGGGKRRFFTNWAELELHSPVSRAAYAGYLEALTFLLAQPAVSKVSTRELNLALECAAAMGHEKIVVLLLAKGANAKSRNNGALLWATTNNHQKIVDMLATHA